MNKITAAEYYRHLWKENIEMVQFLDDAGQALLMHENGAACSGGIMFPPGQDPKLLFSSLTGKTPEKEAEKTESDNKNPESDNKKQEKSAKKQEKSAKPVKKTSRSYKSRSTLVSDQELIDAIYKHKGSALAAAQSLGSYKNIYIYRAKENPELKEAIARAREGLLPLKKEAERSDVCSEPVKSKTEQIIDAMTRHRGNITLTARDVKMRVQSIKVLSYSDQRIRKLLEYWKINT